jgi:hypothetical protein
MSFDEDPQPFTPTADEQRKINIARQVFRDMSHFTVPYITVVAKTLGSDEEELSGQVHFCASEAKYF